jgi:class 3 adenylate cyclase
MALALIRAGAPREAGRILNTLGEDKRDEETLGLRASVLKSQWEQSTDPTAKASFLDKAVAAYEESFAETGGYWTGINAATLSLVRGGRSHARDIAGRVHRMCTERLPGAQKECFWLLATLAEACLVLERRGEAWDWYAKAAAQGRGNASLGDLSKTRRNAILILQAYGLEADDMLLKCLPMPGVVVFTGHMIDRPDRAIPRFPPELENAVRREIKEKLEENGCGLGYASAACGADIIFHESLRKRGGESHVILPYDEVLFRTDCVSFPEKGDWTTRFVSVLENAMDVFTVSQHGPVRGGLNYRYTNSILDGHAKIMARQLGTTLTRLVVWDGRQGDGPGGTHDLVSTWREQGHMVVVIDTRELLDREIPELSRKKASPTIHPVPSAPLTQAEPTRIMAMLFADAKGFSKLSEDQVVLFVEEFMGSIARLLQGSPHAPVHGNTWGDGIFLVFDSVASAGLFALEMCEHVAEVDWGELGLPEDMGIRIGLHAGPVSAHFDQISGRAGYYGTHISRAARIEPITPPGQVYASQQFAALAASEGVEEFVCEYKGETQMAKKYGAFPTFHVRRLAPRPVTAGRITTRRQS